MDGVLKGRFFIKIIPVGPYYLKLDFSIGKDNFAGVGWHQRKSDSYEASNSPVITIKPTSNSGTFRAFCDSTLISEVKYTDKPFNIQLNLNKSCDVEFSATSNDYPQRIEMATYIEEVSYKTVDITPPVVSFKKKDIVFTFMDKDKNNKPGVVIGVKIDSNKPCIKTNTCATTHNKDLYTVRALTPSGRFYWGQYRVSTKRWEVIK
jgi:hypothetical protein